jgi:hypothetical protein
VPDEPPDPPVAEDVTLDDEEAPLEEVVLRDALGLLVGVGLVEGLAEGLVEGLELPAPLGLLEAVRRPDGVAPLEALRDAPDAVGLSEDPDPRLTA